MNHKYQEFIKGLENKKIAIIGAGVSNLPLLKILKEHDFDITLFDEKKLEEMPKDAYQYVKSNNIKCFLGKDYLKHLVGFDIIFRSPSMLPTNNYLKQEINRGAVVTTEIEEVIRLAPCPIIGVTGSKGKTTTTAIIYNILKELKKNVYLGGNIGTPLFSKLDEMKNTDIVVLELSSFQLINMKVSPHIAVITNITPDHLDIHADYQEYIDSKCCIFRNQNSNDILVLNADDLIVSKFSELVDSKIRYFSEKNTYVDNYVLRDNYIMYNDEIVLDVRKLFLRGKHNYLNICAALNAISDYIDVDNKTIEKIIMNIKGVSHRLEFVREKDGVKWYNDSASTTPDKAIAGIVSFSEDVVLIAGGYDKNIPFEPLAKPILEHVSKLILFGDTKDKIYQVVLDECHKTNKNIPIYLLDTLEEVVEVADKISVDGEVVLFSPACASFDMFKNAYQRGDLFKELVKEL